MAVSKAWDWGKGKEAIWLKPCEESYTVAHDWKEKGFRDILDFGCGLGRHSILFSKEGFNVKAFDLSKEGVNYLKSWAKDEGLNIDVDEADMLNLPYNDNQFDAIIAYNVISHTDTMGMKKIVDEIVRVLKVGGEIFLTLCSKETWSFKEAGYPKLDENTVVRTEEGPEKGIPHFYVDFDDIFGLFENFDILKIRHIDDCFVSGKKQNSKHYFVYAKLNYK